MPLDDSVFGGGASLDQLQTDLLSHYQPADGEPFSSDPSQLTRRLARKIGQQPAAPEIDFTPKQAKEAKPEKANDLSSFGEPAPEESSDDLSSFGEAVKPEAPKAGVLATLGNEATAFGKGLLRGAPEAVGSMSQGGAALAGPVKPESPESAALIDELGTSKDMTASQRAKLMGRALRTIGDRGLQTDFNAALQRIARGADPQAEAQAIRDKFSLQNSDQYRPVEQQIRSQAGKKLKDWIDKTVPMTDVEKDSIGGRVGTGISAMAPYLAAGIVLGPEAGMILGAAGMGAQTAGDTFEAAKAKGATDDEAVKAAGWGAGIGAAMGTLPLAAVFKPVSAASSTWKSWMAAKLVQAGQSGVTFATVGEAQEYLLQQVAKEQYDPKAGYSPDAKRVISGLLTGGVLGTMHPLTPKPSDLSSPEAVADFLRRASATGRTPEEEAAHQRGAQTRSEIDDFLRQKDEAEAAGRPRLPAPEGGEQGPAEAAPAPPPEAPKSPTGGEPAAPQASTEATERDGLIRYGWTAEEVDAMTPAQRRAEFQDAMARGTSEPPKQPDNNPVKTDENASGTIPSVDEPNASGTRAEPIKASTAQDVLAAQPAEPKSPAQAEAENFKHAHMEIEHLGLTGRHSISIETGAGQTRKGTDPDGKPWEVKMPVAYGRIKGTRGADGQPLDIFIGPVPTSHHIFVVDQHHASGGGFDEHKIMAGFPGPDAAIRAYGDSYSDHGGDRIGHVTALTPDQFKDWLKGDTTQPLKKTFSEKEIGDFFDELVPPGTSPEAPAQEEHTGQKGGETETLSQEMVSPQLPHGPSDGGRSPEHAGAELEGPRAGVVAAGKDHAEPTDEHHAQIEAVLGNDYHSVLPVDAARAAELLAGNPSMSPALAFQYAVIENAYRQKLLSDQELEQAYGPQVKQLLATESAQPHPGRAPAEAENPPSGQAGARPAEAGELPGGGAAGAPAAQNPPATHSQQHDTKGQEPNAERPSGNKTAEKSATPAKGSEPAKGVEVPEGFEVDAAEHTPEKDLDRGKFTAVARRLSPWSVERGYGKTPAEAQNDALKRLDAFIDPTWLKIAKATRNNKHLMDINGGAIQNMDEQSPSRLMRFPLEYRDGELIAKHEALLDTPFTKKVEEASGLKAKVGKTASGDHSFYHHVVDLADDKHWHELAKTADLVSPKHLFLGVAVGVHHLNLSPANARKLLKAIGEDELPKAEILHAMSKSSIGNTQQGEALNMAGDHEGVSPQERMWAWIVAVEDGYVKKGRGGFLQPTQKVKDLIANGPKETPPEPEKPKPVFSVDGADNMRADVYPNKDGKRFNVTVHDVDAGETLPTIKIVDSLERAKTEARKLVKAPVIAPRKAKKASAVDRAENYFRPGRVVNGYGGKDEVLAFHRGDGERWTVDVRSTKPNGTPNPSERIRNHSTFPDERELAKWERDNPVGSDKPKATSLADAFTERLTGDGFKNILDARRLAKEHGVDDLKAVEETLELAAVKAARAIVEKEKAPYPELVKLYERQPRLGTRTSTSIRDQAYSTPVPLAYVADRLAGITKETTVYEPTAGNGALLLTADPAKVRANELNPARAKNLKDQGFEVREGDALTANTMKRVDRVIANPPFGVVREGSGESRVFDQSHIQPGYKTTEIDHAISLHALDAMKDDGKAVLILGGLNKQLTSQSSRSAGYNAKAKREFYKTLYDNYNVTDHFTVAGELYERQGAGWPVDVIVINGRGKSARALPAVDVPRIYDSWEALGGLLDGQDSGSNAGTDVRPDGGAAPERPGLEGNSGLDRGNAGRRGPASRGGQEERPEGVRDEPVRGQSEADGAGGAGDQEQGGSLPDRPAVRSGKQPAAERSPSRLSADEIGDVFDDLVGGDMPADTRPTGEVAKSAVKNAASAADEALSGLTALFGGGKTLGMGVNFDEETYKKARPMFEAAAEKFADFKYDIRELMRRMIDHLKDAYQWTTDMVRKARPYVIQFMQDVQDGTVNLNKKAETPAPKRESKAVETEGQAVYEPQSKTPGLDTLVPVNMKRSISDALAGLEKKVGPIDDFVAKELGYDKAKLEDYFGAEQIDAIALAIDNLNRGKGFIIGDQTGIGKGRVNAAIIKWALNKGRVPVFTTMMPDLYADIFRDMTDIGMKPPRILATNTGLSLPLDDKGTVTIKTADSTKHNALLRKMSDPDEFRKHYDMVVTTYAQMQTVKGESTDRRRFLQGIIPNGTILFDESHNAGGQAATERKAKSVVAGRSDFARDLVRKANGVFYSSATYAKRPDVMDLYAATDMAMAVENPRDLGEAIAKGGIPMQQAVAAMLAKSGQYIRRERSFAGINYNTPSVKVDHEAYDEISRSLASIQDFSAKVKDAVQEISKDLKAEAKGIGADNATSDAGAQSTNFTSIMHNIINQMLLAMKAPEAAKLAIEHIKAGQKPVLTVANTMESFLKDYADSLDIKVGDEIDADFADVLMKYLERSRRITIRKPFGKEKEYHYLTDEELGPDALEAYNNAKAQIAGLDLSGMPISPIDHLKAELQKAGYEVGEITGRGLVIDYTGDRPVLRNRPGGEITTKGKNETRRKFNTLPEKGGSHAIIINQSGSTGVSMHASKTFGDQRKRRMIIVQPEANIDTHMQLLGRVNRTGQVVLPEYDQLVADIPAEKRPAAVLAKKMASLNANTTAARSSAVTAKDVPDFINQYGDQVAVNYLADNLELNERLALPVKPGEGGKLKPDDAMRKVTGRIPLLPLAEQEALYEYLEEEYAALIKQLEASGSSPLEAKTFDLKARTLETTEVQGSKNASGSPFAAPVHVEKASILKQGKPFKPEELIQQLANRLGVEPPPAEQHDRWLTNGLAPLEARTSGHAPYISVEQSNRPYDIEVKERTAAVKEFDEYVRPLITKIEDAKEQEKERAKYNAIKDRWTGLHSMLPIGKRVRLNMFDANPVAVVLDVKQTGKAKNPLALSSWKVSFAVADATRQMTLPFSRLYQQGQSDPESMLDVEVVPTNETAKDTLARFEMMQSGAREERYIATGNLLAAYDWLNMKGAIINYTDEKGAVHQGIMTPKDFKVGEHAIKKGRVVSDPAEIKTFLDQMQTLWSKDRQANISRADRWSDNYQIQAEKKKATGGRYYLDPALTALTGDFVSRGGMMTATVPGGDLGKAITRMQEIGAAFTVAAAAPKAQKIEHEGPPPDDEPPPSGGGPTLASRVSAAPNRLTNEAQRLNAQIEQHLRDVVNRVAGPGVKVDFSKGLIRLGGNSPGYTADTGNLAAGVYSLGSDLIRLALVPGNADQMITAAFHESYHHIEARLQTEQERKLMEAETPRLREWIKGKTGLRDEQVDGLAGYEVRAIAFQSYANERSSGKSQPGSGIHIMVRRWFDRLWEALRTLANGLRGLGFKTYTDIFNDAYTGKFAAREPSESINLDPASMAAMADLFRRQDTAVTGRLRDVMNSTTAFDRVKEKVQNLNEGVRLLEDAVQARMDGELPDSKAFYQKKRLFPGKVATEVQDFNKQHLDPLIDTLKERGLTLDQVGDIVYAQHAAERNAYIDTINPDLNGMGSGMSDEEAQAILDRYDTRDLTEIAHRVSGIRDFILDTMVNAGLESRATADAWRARYEHYVPLGGFEERDPNREDETFREPGKFNVRGREVKRAFGRSSKADNPMVNLLDQAYRTIERAKKNEYLRSLKLALSGLEPEDRKGFVQFDRGKMKPEIDPRTGLVRYVDDTSYRFDPKAVAYKVGGNTHYMVFEKRATADVLRRMHPDALNGVGQALLTMQNKLKAMWTHYSPEFLIRHFLFRYPIEGTINSFEQGPSNVPRYMADSIPFLGRASKAIFATNKGIVHDNPDVAQYQRYWEEMRKAGGAMAFRQARDVDLLREHLNKKLSAISGRPLATVMDKHRAAVEAMDTVTNALDNSLRLAAYATARRQGKTPEQAAIVARDATVDFQQAGQWKNALGLWFPFGNVAIQTGARMGTAVNRSKIMRRVFLGTIAAGFMSAMFNYLVGGDDKDGTAFFDKLPEWDKHLNFTVLHPFHTDDKGRPVPIKIPLPYNWAFPFALGQAMATMAFSKTKGAVRKMIAMATMAGVEAFTPFAQEGNLAALLAPELTRPAIHAYTNQNWTGNPIHLDPAFQKGPRSESGRKSTGDGWKYSTSMLNAMSGGDKHHAGYLDMFPEDLRELFDYYSGTGTQRKFVSNVATTTQNAASGKPVDYSKIPLARVFMGTDYDAADRAHRQEKRREEKRPWEHR